MSPGGWGSGLGLSWAGALTPRTQNTNLQIYKMKIMFAIEIFHSVNHSANFLQICRVNLRNRPDLTQQLNLFSWRFLVTKNYTEGFPFKTNGCLFNFKGITTKLYGLPFQIQWISCLNQWISFTKSKNIFKILRIATQ